jgi:hypothetical protein
MKKKHLCLTGAFLALLATALSLPTKLHGQESAMPQPEAHFDLSGVLGLSGKYNSNLNLVDNNEGAPPRQDAFLVEPNASLRLSGTWDPRWWLALEYSGQANFHSDHSGEDWYFNRGSLALSRFFGPHSLNLSSQLRHFTEPGNDRYDFVRHTGLLSYRHHFSQLWQARAGYENIVTRYPQTRSLDYTVHGLFVEARNTWTTDLTTYYLLDLQYYRGTADPQENNPNASPEEGKRRAIKIGFDWVLSPQRLLSGTYTFQDDQSDTADGVRQINDFEGYEGSQDIEAEFDLRKHKTTLLYSHRWGRRYTVSIYGEWIRKRFNQTIEIDLETGKEDGADDDENEIKLSGERRTNSLFLSSAFVKARLNDRWRLKLRYLFRLQRSSAPRQDYTDHLFFFGPEFSF